MRPVLGWGKPVLVGVRAWGRLWVGAEECEGSDFAVLFVTWSIC